MHVKQGSVLFPQSIYAFYHAVTGVEKVRNLFVVLCFYVIAHLLTLDLVVINSLIMKKRIVLSTALYLPVYSTFYSLFAYRVKCGYPDRFAGYAN